MTHTDQPPADERKRELRREIRRRRRARVDRGDPAARRRDAQLLAAAVLDLLADLRADLADGVAVYESLPTEPPTEVLAETLRERGVRVLVPVLLPDKDLDWRRWGPERASETLGVDAIGEVAVIVVPALAIDGAGARLGQGGGSYDRALARRRRDATVIAMVFDDEVLDSPVPVDAHDQGVDAVVTPSGHRRPRRNLGLG